MLAFSTPPLMELAWRPVAADLRPFVTAYVERRDARGFPAMRELPVPAPLIQLMLGADIHLQTGGASNPAPRAALWGPSSGAACSRTDGPLHCFVIVLTFQGAVMLARSTPGPLADRLTPLDGLLTASSRRRLADVYAAADVEGRVEAVERWLRPLFLPAPPIDPATAMIDAIMQHALTGPVACVARSAGISERAVHKRCERLLGWSPKRLLRIARLQRVLGALHPSPWLARPDAVDARLEYADDSHLAHDMKNLTGLTISAYRSAKRATGDRLVHTVLQT